MLSLTLKIKDIFNKIKTVSDDIYTAMNNLKKDTNTKITNLNNDLNALTNTVNDIPSIPEYASTLYMTEDTYNEGKKPAPESGKLKRGLTVRPVYDSTTYPETFGNALQIGGAGQGELFCAWDGNYADNAITNSVYYRSCRDVRENWGPWRRLLFADEITADKKENGYLRLPNGLILQWGLYTESQGQNDYKYFPIAFPNVCLNIQSSFHLAGTNRVTDWGNLGTWVVNVDRQKFLCGVAQDFAGGDRHCSIFAIGY